MHFIDCLLDDNLLGRFLEDKDTWSSWFTLWRAFYGLPAEPGDLELFRSATGRQDWPQKSHEELFSCCGVRSGKSNMIALLAIYEALFKQHKLSIGEEGNIIIVSNTQNQAKIIKKYISGIVNDYEPLRQKIKRETRENIDFENNISIKVLPSNYATLRGYTCLLGIIDEIGYLAGAESTRPDHECLDSLRSRVATVKDGKIICIGSPHAKRGSLYKSYQLNYGKPTSTLFWKAPTKMMNPTVRQSVIDRAKLEDLDKYKADYLAEFRSDIEIYVNPEVVEACVIPGRYELPYYGGNSYFAFIDPSGGSGQDSMCLAIGHNVSEVLVIDCLREHRPPFSPDRVVEDFVTTLKSYGISRVTGDNWGGDWVKRPFELAGISYDVSPKNKHKLYQGFLAKLNSKQVQLLDNKRLIAQICGLERRVHAGGADKIDHSPGNHDDLSNVVAGVAAQLGSDNRAGTWGSPPASMKFGQRGSNSGFIDACMDAHRKSNVYGR